MRLKTRNEFPCEINCDRYTGAILVAHNYGKIDTCKF